MMYSYAYIVVLLLTISPAKLITAQEPVFRSPICTERNGYHKVEGNCGAYIKCVDFVAKQFLCPEGLHFNPNTKWPEYPCGLLADIACPVRDPPKQISTAECPHRFGYLSFATTIPRYCDQYRVCLNGQAFNMQCPAGLVFNPENNQCDWPELVPSCKSKDMFGFNCPASAVDFLGNPIDLNINYPYEGKCFEFFSCYQGNPHLMKCEEGLAFDQSLSRCVDADLVNCNSKPELIIPAPDSSKLTPEIGIAVPEPNTPFTEFNTPNLELTTPISEFNTHASESDTIHPTLDPELITPTMELSTSFAEINRSAQDYVTSALKTSEPTSEVATFEVANTPAIELGTLTF